MKKLSFVLLLCLGFVASMLAQPCQPNTASLSFNGTSSSVRLNPGSSLEITDQITVEAWIYATSFGASFTSGSIVCKHSWDPQTYGYVLRAGGSGQLSFNIGTSSGWQEVLSDANALMLNTWYHVAGTFDGTNLSLYINGILQGTTPYSGTIAGNTGLPARIGGLADTAKGMSRYWNGYIDEVRIWHRALTVTEIVAGMNDHVDPSTALQLAGYWRLNDSPYSNCTDLSGNGNYGGCFNTTWTTIVPFNNVVPPTPVITFSGGQLHSSSGLAYQWYFAGNLIPGATLQNFTPVNYGNYSVQVGNPPCVSLSAPFNYNTTGIEDPGKAGIRISPNPAKDKLTLELPPSCFGSDYGIYSAGGQLIKSGKTGSVALQIMDISNLAPGLYFLKISNINQTSMHKLLVR